MIRLVACTACSASHDSFLSHGPTYIAMHDSIKQQQQVPHTGGYPSWKVLRFFA